MMDSFSPFDPSSINPENCDNLKKNLFQDESQDTTTTTTSSTNCFEKLAIFLRLRPIDESNQESVPYKIENSNLLYVNIPDEDRKVCSKRSKYYQFTKIFDEYADQATVFSKCCLPLVNDFLSGTNALLFCYGTTSSGKSYTMRGPPNDPDSDPGLIPLSLRHIFESFKFCQEPVVKKVKFCDFKLLNAVEQQDEIDYKTSILSQVPPGPNLTFDDSDADPSLVDNCDQYLCYISYFEIYNDYIYDLLLPPSAGRSNSLKLRQDESERYYVDNLSSIMVSSLSEAMQIYEYGLANLNRNIQETGANKTSSRSHSFFSISSIKFRVIRNELVKSQISSFTLGDLAGSERQSNANTFGIRTKEGGSINGSLFQLRECLKILKKNQQNPNKSCLIPYKNAKLTTFLQPYLSGTGRVWMIININPSRSMVRETLGTLALNETAADISTNNQTIMSRLEESKRRMTQLWLQSSVRWSSFTNKNKNINVPQVVIEEANEKENLKIDQAQFQNILAKHEIEVERVRQEIADHYDELIRDINKEHDEQIRVLKDNHHMFMEDRVQALEHRFKTKISEMRSKIEELEDELYDATESNTHLNDKVKELQAFKDSLQISRLEQEVQTEEIGANSTEPQEDVKAIRAHYENLLAENALLIDSMQIENADLRFQLDQFECTVSKIVASESNEPVTLQDSLNSLINKLNETEEDKKKLQIALKEFEELKNEEFEVIQNKLNQLDADLKLKINNYESEIESLQLEKVNMAQEVEKVNQINSELKEELEKTKAHAIEQIERLQKEQIILTEKLNDCQQELMEVKTDFSIKSSAYDDNIKQLESIAADKLVNLEDTITIMNKELASLRTIKSELEAKITDLRNEITLNNNEYRVKEEDWKIEEEALHEAISDFVSDLSEAFRREICLKYEIEQISKNSIAENLRIEKKLGSCVEKMSETLQILSNLKANITEVNLEDTITIMNKELASLRTIKSELEAKIEKLKNEIEYRAKQEARKIENEAILTEIALNQQNNSKIESVDQSKSSVSKSTESEKLDEKLVHQVLDYEKYSNIEECSTSPGKSDTPTKMNENNVSTIAESKTEVLPSSVRKARQIIIDIEECSPSFGKSDTSTKMNENNVSTIVESKTEVLPSSVQKARQIIIDANDIPATNSEWKKKKNKSAERSPFTAITNEYLHRFCPPSSTKKSVKKPASARKPSSTRRPTKRKETRKSEPESVPELDTNYDDGVEDDELASLLKSHKKGKKESSNNEDETKIPTKRRKLPVADSLFEANVSPSFADEPSSQNIVGGRTLRPRRKIKF